MSAAPRGRAPLPSCRLMTNSNLVGCMTGRSAGFAPLRIRRYRCRPGETCPRIGPVAHQPPASTSARKLWAAGIPSRAANVANWTRRLTNNMSPARKRHPSARAPWWRRRPRSRGCCGVEDGNLESQRARRIRHVSQRASLIAFWSGLTSTAIRTALGTRSCRSPSRFATTSAVKKLMPVALPPGRARLAIRPSLTGSSPAPKAIGMVVVAALPPGRRG